MQKANELYDAYYKLYCELKYELEHAKGLIQECKENTKENDMMEYTLNLNLL